jgi:hypothetical protein
LARSAPIGRSLDDRGYLADRGHLAPAEHDFAAVTSATVLARLPSIASGRTTAGRQWRRKILTEPPVKVRIGAAIGMVASLEQASHGWTVFRQRHQKNTAFVQIRSPSSGVARSGPLIGCGIQSQQFDAQRAGRRGAISCQ